MVLLDEDGTAALVKRVATQLLECDREINVASLKIAEYPHESWD
ncbi:hypothetical protein MA5S0921_0186 [Mycobacteroides abscessus 5S-0921]|uniref:Uncharacterized protein n=1 Tax=Mycobacteroides abscessus subsp. bolletii 1513 TaxID=1299321 RepID=X8DZ28_9MYCO|nr:hypothetical protein MA5S0421_4918 [Mycobacteroides abscessus 5S-0421]EIU09021.1 hypothetical protein MA5S0304_4684 [Mycobacteroides abscessus 5S-0304]EIU21490.1 hypothetical protein MA5S0708_4610 [Mycobacteroides abscessus 5S-0708]EIU23854.1 hypothetical protein MA5S0817_4234 [Mycobacteroides abscessus 5S-0817]EIU31529.1 hypothetical protein MA5S1212_1736 [Mycobacteroides abscessus 5S-1212]EIU43184.1 hypothetical protein MA5S1215_4637 [Mycobacteroides abscessus 5S-1215]EIV01493.1 hypothet